MKHSVLFPIAHRCRQTRSLVLLTIAAICLFLAPVFGAATSNDSTSNAKPDNGYRIDQPGTITFTVGVKISGKVEKPQVMIFLPKEKTLYRDELVSRSFYDELIQPLPFTPLTE